MQFSNEAKFNEIKSVNADDPYGARCVSYAEDWANLMEAEIAKSPDSPIENILKDHAHRTSLEADTDGITGFMYSMSAKILSECWLHGEALRRWHNLANQIGDEGEKANQDGGILNTALLIIVTPDE